MLAATEPGPCPSLLVRDPAAIACLLRAPGAVGLGRAWAAGLLDVEGSLTDVLRLRHGPARVSVSLADRARLLTSAVRVAGVAALRPPPRAGIEARPRGARHSVARDGDAVRHHYDLSTGFFRAFLGPTMVYSCAYFESPEESLEQAQSRKLELICQKLRLRSGDRLLDVGCGWGSLILHAALNHGVRAVGVTLSPMQAGAARERIAAAGAKKLCEVRVADYREVVDGPFDAIASVGMYEHVGLGQLGAYARAIKRLMRPGGLFLNHGITRLSSEAPGRATFISQFVFPDGELHPLTAILRAMEQAGLEIRDVESLREHYTLTLRRWLENLEDQREVAIREAGEAHERVWRLYMSGAASAFEDGELSVFQTLAVRPGGPHRLPLIRTPSSSHEGDHHEHVRAAASTRRPIDRAASKARRPLGGGSRQ